MYINKLNLSENVFTSLCISGVYYYSIYSLYKKNVNFHSYLNKHTKVVEKNILSELRWGFSPFQSTGSLTFAVCHISGYCVIFVYCNWFVTARNFFFCCRFLKFYKSMKNRCPARPYTIQHVEKKVKLNVIKFVNFARSKKCEVMSKIDWISSHLQNAIKWF